MTGQSAANLARHIEHTRLSANTTGADIERLCAEAVHHDFFGVCVNLLFIARARALLGGHATQVVTVVGFPLGATLPRVVAYEARCAVEEGADEVDMVIPVGAALAGEFESITAQVQAVRDATAGHVLKVILETGYLTAAQVQRSATAALQGKPEFLKTSTGFGPRGASVEDVQQLCALCPPGVAVKASGGIRTRSDALAMLSAGATRLGTSSSVAIVSVD